MARAQTQGFTLLELMLVISVLAIVVTLGRDFYGNYVRGLELETAAKAMAADLRLARERALAGQEGRNWGLYLVNGSSDYYELFSSPSDYDDPAKTVLTKTYLSRTLFLAVPNEGLSQAVIFSRTFATATPASITLSGLGAYRTITVGPSGSVN